MRPLILVPVALLLGSCMPPRPRSEADPRLIAEIDRIQAIDNHAHPPRNAADHDYDPLPADAMEPGPVLPRLDPSNPVFKVRRASKSPVEVLDAAHIDLMLANRIAMGPELDPRRFKWVAYADALMYPLANERLGARDPDRKRFFEAEDKLLKRYLAEAGLGAVPSRFEEYLNFVTRTIERHRAQGAVAEKFEMAYLRTLEVGLPVAGEAAKVYAQFVKGGLPGNEEYKVLQDFLFRHIAQTCGRLGMPVHIHSMAGVGTYYDVAGASPVHFDLLLNDPALRKTQFVAIHGGWPWVEQSAALLMKPNFWVDFSAMSLLLPPRALSQAIRTWLEWGPERVLFGTDAGPWGPGLGLDETARGASATSREALALALTGMLRDGEVTGERALELAHMVMRDNARRLYGFK